MPTKRGSNFEIQSHPWHTIPCASSANCREAVSCYCGGTCAQGGNALPKHSPVVRWRWRVRSVLSTIIPSWACCACPPRYPCGFRMITHLVQNTSGQHDQHNFHDIAITWALTTLYNSQSLMQHTDVLHSRSLSTRHAVTVEPLPVMRSTACG